MLANENVKLQLFFSILSNITYKPNISLVTFLNIVQYPYMHFKKKKKITSVYFE